MPDLPMHLPLWEPWRKEIKKRIEEIGVTRDLQRLREAGCKEEQLLFRLAAVAAEHGKSPTRRATGLTVHQLKMAPKKLRDAAKLVDQLERAWRPDGDAIEYEHSLANSLRSYADGLDGEWGIQSLLKPSRMTLELAARCSLVAYVQQATGKNHDEELAALIGAALGKDSYYATHLTQWRSKHQGDIERFRFALVNPLTQRAPRK